MNQELDFLQSIFSTEIGNISLITLLLQLLLSTVLSLIVGMFYVRYGTSLSNRTALSKTFVLIGVTTMLIITIVKSSLALSLGLVGALSIVRFRTAIKEPEELAYFFVLIGVGLGIGAEQFWVTAIGTLVLCMIIFFLNRKNTKDVVQNVVIGLKQSEEGQVEQIISIIESYCTALELKRLDEQEGDLELSFSAHFVSINQLLAAKNSLKKTFPTSTFRFLQIV